MKKKFGFTIMEITLVLVVLGIIIAVTISSALRSDSAEEKKLKLNSSTFYQKSELAFTEIVKNETNMQGIKNLTSDKLMEYFLKYLEDEIVTNEAETSETGETSETSETNTSAESAKEDVCAMFTGGSYDDYNVLQQGTACAKFSNKIIAGFYIDNNCEQSFKAKEFKDNDKDIREITNACGYIVFEQTNSKGVFGEDVFVIGLGNRRFK